MEEKNNRLDDFIRLRLRDDTADPSWNVPGDEIFEHAIRSQPKRRRRFGIFWIVLTSGLLLLLSTLGYLHFHQVTRLQAQIEQLENQITSTEKYPTPETSDLAVHSVGSSHDSDVQEDLRNGYVQGYHAGNNNTLSFSRTKDIASVDSEMNFHHSQSDDVKTRNPIDQDGEVIPANPDLKNSNQLLTVKSDRMDMIYARIPMITNQVSAAEQTIDSDIPPLTAGPIMETENKINFLRLGVLLLGNQSWYTMKNVPASMSARLTNYEQAKPGYGMEMLAEFSLRRKWFGQGGISYQAYQNRSFRQNQFQLEMENVSMGPDNQLYYHADFNLMNPLGDYPHAIEFRFSDEMEEHDQMEEKTQIQQWLKTLQLKLSLNRVLMELPRMDVFAGLGTSIAFRTGVENNFKVSLYHKDNLYINVEEKSQQPDHVRQIQILGFGQIGLDYQLDKHFQLRIQTAYQHGLSSVRETTGTNGTKTYLHGFSLSAGLMKHF